jgi:hypothetical protein
MWDTARKSDSGEVMLPDTYDKIAEKTIDTIKRAIAELDRYQHM